MRVGLEILESDASRSSRWGRCAVVANQASMTARYRTAWEVAKDVLGQRLVALFGPQHGFFGTVQDNMIETEHALHPLYRIPIYSLYSKVRKPTPEMLANVDTLIVDLQITGTRIYTFKATVALCLQACAESGKRLVVLDRPNPVGGVELEGLVLEKDCHSFVGPHPMPMRHALTMGEFARLLNRGIGAELEVVGLEGWRPEDCYQHLDRPWVITSPNMPHPDTAVVYPGLVMLEGTNLSEGRGTCLPFQFVGAPYLPDGEKFVRRVQELLRRPPADYGVFLRACEFMPTFQKWAGQVCRGLQVHVTDPRKVKSFDLALAAMRAALEIGGDQFAFKAPPYEYEYHDLPMKFIFGSRDIAERLTAPGFDLRDEYWHRGHANYARDASGVLLYERRLRPHVPL